MDSFIKAITKSKPKKKMSLLSDQQPFSIAGRS